MFLKRSLSTSVFLHWTSGGYPPSVSAFSSVIGKNEHAAKRATVFNGMLKYQIITSFIVILAPVTEFTLRKTEQF